MVTVKDFNGASFKEKENIRGKKPVIGYEKSKRMKKQDLAYFNLKKDVHTSIFYGE
jgi:hypothetical protein